jgi:succinate dehydrogenase / fumarate reductase, cytochrome b subunit
MSDQQHLDAGGFFHRHDFLIRRLHSLSGIVPIGAYMVVHLMTNASILGGAASFQKNVNSIHALGPALPFIEWAFIFGPIIFHALVGVWIAMTGAPNTSQYRFTRNRRYSWQRYTGYFAIIFIFLHVFHLHGWFHFDAWVKYIAEPLGMAQFKPYNAASTLAEALQGYAWPVFYAAGVLACTFHFANGLWTAGITWGLWLTPKAQNRATILCSAFGVFICLVGLSALWGVKKLDIEDAKEVEKGIYKARIDSREIVDDPHKRSDFMIESNSSPESASKKP